jgi:surface antigen
MTEREMPDGVAFLFGGQTNDSEPAFAPSAVSEPEFLMTSTPDSATSSAPVYLSRREMRAAGGYGAHGSANPAADRPVVPAVVEPAAAAPGRSSLEATQAMAVVDIVAELAASVAPTAAVAVPTPSAPPLSISSGAATEQFDVASFLGFGTSESVALSSAPPSSVNPTVARVDSRRARRDATSGLPPERRPARERAAVAPRTARSASQRKSLRQRITGAGVSVLVAGLFTVLALPAYADNNASALTESAAVRTQRLAVSAAAATTTTASISRDGYTATSATALKSLYSNAMRQQNIAAYLQSGAMQKGDDYPWYAELSRNQGGGLSPLGYYYRECVDFVAWRLNRDAGTTQAPFKWTWSKLTPNGGDGSQWKAAWLAHGWPTGTTPKPGSVAWFGTNHVGYVNGILDNGQVLIEEYNWTPHAYSTRLINPGDAYYLYAPPA